MTGPAWVRARRVPSPRRWWRWWAALAALAVVIAVLVAVRLALVVGRPRHPDRAVRDAGAVRHARVVRDPPLAVATSEPVTPELFSSQQFSADLASSKRVEASMVWRELIALTLVVVLVVVRQLWFV